MIFTPASPVLGLETAHKVRKCLANEQGGKAKDGGTGSFAESVLPDGTPRACYG